MMAQIAWNQTEFKLSVMMSSCKRRTNEQMWLYNLLKIVRVITPRYISIQYLTWNSSNQITSTIVEAIALYTIPVLFWYQLVRCTKKNTKTFNLPKNDTNRKKTIINFTFSCLGARFFTSCHTQTTRLLKSLDTISRVLLCHMTFRWYDI
jgi:hypothetical protein